MFMITSRRIIVYGAKTWMDNDILLKITVLVWLSK